MKIGAKFGGVICGAVMAIAMPFTAQHEGLRLKAYLDPVGIPTICYGETEGVALGQVKSRDECDQMLAARLAWFGWNVEQMAGRALPPETHAALSSFAYNVGLEAYRNSTLLRKLKAGDLVGACDELPRWRYAAGRELPGLVRRREAERQLCLRGVS